MNMDYSNIMNIYNGINLENEPEDYYLIDFTKEDIMSREIFEDILYVLLNLILANTIVKYVKKINLKDISSEDFFSKIHLLMDKHYLKYKDEYKYLIILRKFSINNYMSDHSVEMMSFHNLSEFEKEKLDKKYTAELRKLNTVFYKYYLEYMEKKV
jgi:hypothetical protein